jgi:hypothetical protein
MTLLIEGETRLPTGRKPNPIVYNELEDCVECTISYNGNPIKFLIDKEDLESVKTRNWHAITNGKYIGANIRINGIIKTLYLHNFVMNKLNFPGKGSKESIDHIDRNGLNNRKQNLRLATQTEQNFNQKKKSRIIILPEDCGINPNDIPKNIYYVKARGAHGHGFCVEFKQDGKKIYNPYIRSKIDTLKQIFEKIKEKLEEGYKIYPEFRPV